MIYISSFLSLTIISRSKFFTLVRPTDQDIKSSGIHDMKSVILNIFQASIKQTVHFLCNFCLNDNLDTCVGLYIESKSLQFLQETYIHFQTLCHFTIVKPITLSIQCPSQKVLTKLQRHGSTSHVISGRDGNPYAKLWLSMKKDSFHTNKT